MTTSPEELRKLADKEEFEAAFKYLNFSCSEDAWGQLQYTHSHVHALWTGWQKGRDALRRTAPAPGWHEGSPPNPWGREWFIAETTYGDRVVLRELPKEFTYDYKTADETYIKRDKIKRWMQFPDSHFIAHIPPAPGWRLIEDAPKDGTKFDAWCVHGGVSCRFTDIQMRGDGSGFGFIQHGALGPEWHYLERADDVYPTWTPTHYMPLPSPPTLPEERK